MSITFTQTTKITFDEISFQHEFHRELKESANAVAIPYETFVKIIWNLVIEQLGDNYDMDKNGYNDGNELDESTAGYAIRLTVHEIIREYTTKVSDEQADEWETSIATEKHQVYQQKKQEIIKQMDELKRLALDSLTRYGE